MMVIGWYREGGGRSSACGQGPAGAVFSAGAHGAQADEKDPNSALARVQCEAGRVGWNNADALLANLVGLLSQTYEATAGLNRSTTTLWRPLRTHRFR
jgi:hypothetical protein